MKNLTIRILALLLFFCFTLSGQNAKNSDNKGKKIKVPWNVQESKKRSTSDFLKLAETSDMLYLNDDPTSLYLMKKSPLNAFDNYRDIYDAYHKFAIVEYQTDVTGFIPPNFYRQGLNTTYYVLWLLIDGSLYLGNIKFFDNSAIDSVFTDNKQYRIMEEVTQVKSDKELGRKYVLQNSMEIEDGLMPAVWVSDTLLIKRGRGPYFKNRQELNEYRKAKIANPEDYPDDSIETWVKTPCIELVFQKGKLVSMREREDMH